MLAFTLHSCKATRNVPQGKHLLEKNTVQNIPKQLDGDEVKKVIRQKPNRRLLMFWRFYLNVYNFGSLFKDNKVSRWLKNTVGEEPVLVDPVLTEKTREQLEAYLKTKGFFKATVTDTTIYKRKKAYVNYILNPGTPTTIESVNFNIRDTFLLTLARLDSIRSQIKAGDIYDQDKLDMQRDQLTTLFKRNGYYNFFKEYIYFEADTLGKQDKVAITLGIRQAKGRDSLSGDIVDRDHPKFFINKVRVKMSRGIENEEYKDSITYNGVTFLFNNSMKVLPSVIRSKIFIQEDAVYNIGEAEETYRKLNGLKVFRFINIQFDPETNDLPVNELNCTITLSTLPKQSFSLEPRGTQTEVALGLEGNISYRNRNAFKGAEQLTVRLKGSVEAQKLLAKEEDNGLVEQVVPFNTIEIGPEVTFNVPRFLLPFKIKRQSRIATPLTSFTAAYNFQKRADYTRTILNFTYGYNWNETVYKKHQISVADVNLVKVFRSPAFERYLLNTGDILIRNSYKDQLIPSTRYSFIFNDQGKEGKKNYSYFRANFEVAGNLMAALDGVLPYTIDEENKLRFLNIRFAQYVRTDYDFRRYFNLNYFSNLVVRGAVGVGKPYGNSGASMPFVRSFYAGGSSDIRAWRIRELGPGSLPDSLRGIIEQTGDVKLTANVEYRFDIYKYLKAALFYDAGNIWLLEGDPNRPGGNFDFGRFYKELGMGAGLGFRFDFSFFIIRIDLGVPLNDPAYSEGNRFRLFKLQPRDAVLNLGIGYPF